MIPRFVEFTITGKVELAGRDSYGDLHSPLLAAEFELEQLSVTHDAGLEVDFNITLSNGSSFTGLSWDD